jgi:hypothetical protein
MKKKYLITIKFQLCLGYVVATPSHKEYIGKLMADKVVDTYSVSIENEKSFITVNASSLIAAEKIVKSSPLSKYWNYEIDEIQVHEKPEALLKPELCYN